MYNVIKVGNMETILKDLKISYLKQGTGKENILFLHGWGCNKEIFKQNIDYVSKFMTVYAIDLPGFGKSEEPKEIWNVDNYVDLVIEFIEKMEIKKLSILGHSYGGRIIIKLVNRKNSNFKVDKLVLIDAAGIKKETKTTLSQKIYKNIVPIINKISPKLVNKIKSKIGSTDYRNATPMMRDILVKSVNEDLKDLIPNIKNSTLIIWGENDLDVPYSDAIYMNENIKDSGIVKVENSAHFPFIDEPILVNKVLESFLKR